MSDNALANTSQSWDPRIRPDWDAPRCQAQCRFFAQAAIDNLPDWLLGRMRSDSLTVCDWGCAQGDGTEVWSSYVGAGNLTGADLSPLAISTAACRYPSIRFICEDWLAEGNAKRESFDFVFSANILQHFHRPYDIARTLCHRARKALILMVPYCEVERPEEHLFTFSPGSIPLYLDNGFYMVWARPVNCRDLLETPRSGEQVLLVYALLAWVENLRLTLADTANSFCSGFMGDPCLSARPESLGPKAYRLAVELQERGTRFGNARSALHASLERERVRAAFAESECKSWQLRAEEMENSTSWHMSKPLRTIKMSTLSLIGRVGRLLEYIRQIAHPARFHGLASVDDRLLRRLDPSLATPEHVGIAGLVSIVLPVYNQADFLGQAIEGVFRQTYGSWELIVVNDGSTDSFAEAVAPFLGHPRIHIFEQPNQKLPSALNNGFREARGEYFTWTSADNVMLERQLEKLVGALGKNPQAGLAYSDYIAIDDKGDELADPTWRQHNRPDGTARLQLPAGTTVANFHESGDNFLGASFMWRAEVHRIAGQYDENTFGGEDYDFWLRMHLVTPFVHVPEPLYLYRVHENTLNARARELKLFENVQRLLAADKRRRYVLLKERKTLAQPTTTRSCWRNPGQYLDAILLDAVWVKCSSLDHNARNLHPERVVVLDIDVSLREIDPQALGAADILLTADPLAFAWLREQPLGAMQRVLYIPDRESTDVLVHAVALRHYERQGEREGYVLARKPKARFAFAREFKHAMLLVGRWRNGGMEQVVLDLAAGMVRFGIQVTLGVCDESPNSDMRAASEQLGLAAVGFEGSAHSIQRFVKEHGIDLVSYHYAFLGAEELAADGILTIYTLHNSYVWHDRDQLALWSQGVAPIAAFIAVSRQVADFARRWLAIDANRLHIIPNGTSLQSHAANLDLAYCAPLPPTPEVRYRYLNVATFNRIKCQDRLLRAFAEVVRKVPDVHLTVIGTPADENFYREVIALRWSLGLHENCSILPGTARENVLGLMRDMDCFVLPSAVEGWSISLAEAVLSGMPVVASDVGSARDVAQVSDAVILVPGLLDRVEMTTAEALAPSLAADNRPFEQRLADAMIGAVERRETLRAQARSAVIRAESAFGMDPFVESYIRLATAVRVGEA